MRAAAAATAAAAVLGAGAAACCFARGRRGSAAHDVVNKPVDRQPPDGNVKAKQELLQRVVARAEESYKAALGLEAPALRTTPQDTAAKDLMHRVATQAKRAFWDILAEELAATPPQTDRLTGILEELKQLLLVVTPRKMRANAQVLLSELRLENMQDPFQYDTLAQVVDFFMNRVVELQAPNKNPVTRQRQRDMLTEVQRSAGSSGHAPSLVPRALRMLHDELTTLAEEIHEAKRELAAPYLAREVEEDCRELMRTQAKLGLHTFQNTKAWLKEAVVAGVPESFFTQADLLQKSSAYLTKAPAAAMCRYLCSLQARIPSQGYPETLQLDGRVVHGLADSMQLLVLTAAVSGAASQVARSPKVVPALTREVPALLKKPGMRLPALVDSILHTVDVQLLPQPPLPEDARKLLAGLVTNLVKDNFSDRLYKTYHSRFVNVFQERVAIAVSPKASPIREAPHDSSGTRDHPLPPLGPFSPLEQELSTLVANTAAVIRLNTRCYKPFYETLLIAISDELHPTDEQKLQQK